MATGARKYTFTSDNGSIIIEANIPKTLNEAGVREYVAKTGKRTGEERHISVLNDAGWSEDTGLKFYGYPIRAKVSFTIDLDGARTRKVGEQTVEQFLAERAAKARPADAPLRANGPTATGKSASA